MLPRNSNARSRARLAGVLRCKAWLRQKVVATEADTRYSQHRDMIIRSLNPNFHDICLNALTARSTARRNDAGSIAG